MRLSMKHRKRRKEEEKKTSNNTIPFDITLCICIVIAISYFPCVHLLVFAMKFAQKSWNYVNFPAFSARTKMTCFFINFIIVTSFH